MILSEVANQGTPITLQVSPTAGRGRWADLFDKFLLQGTSADAYVVVFNTRLESFGAASTDLLDDARWIGRPVATAGASAFTVHSMPSLWSSPTSGAQFLAPEVSTGLTWAQIRSNYLGEMGEVQLGSSPAGSWAGSTEQGVPLLNVMAAAAADFGVTWKLDRRGRFVWSVTATNVFSTTPVAALVEGVATPQQVGGTTPAYEGAMSGFLASIEHHTYRIYSTYTSGSGPSRFSVINFDRAGYTLEGEQYFPSRFVSADGMDTLTEATNYMSELVDGYAASDGPSYAFGFTTTDDRVFRELQVGDPVWVFAPDYPGVEDTTIDPVDVAGDVLHPRLAYVWSITSTATDDMTVAIYRSNADTWEDITDDVVLASADASTAGRVELVSDLSLFTDLPADGVDRPSQPPPERAARTGSQPTGPVAMQIATGDGFRSLNPYSVGGPPVEVGRSPLP